MNVRDDRGSATVLTIGLVAVLLAAILTVAAATQVHLQRMRLQHVADEVALASADALDLDGYYAAGTAGESLALSHARLREEAERQLRASSTRQGLDGVRLTAAASPDGATVEVGLALETPVLFGAQWLPARVTLDATAAARAEPG